MGDFHRNYITEEESRVIAMLAEKMICPTCDAPVEIRLIWNKAITWRCTNCMNASKESK